MRVFNQTTIESYFGNDSKMLWSVKIVKEFLGIFARKVKGERFEILSKMTIILRPGHMLFADFTLIYWTGLLY